MPQKELVLTATRNGGGIFPVVKMKVKVNGVKCRALIDSGGRGGEGGGSSYASAKLINLLNKNDVRVKQVDMLRSTSLLRLETYQTTVEAVTGDFQMNVKLIKVNKGELFTLDNP